MTETEITDSNSSRPPVGNLTDFLRDADGKTALHVEIAVKDDGRVVVFYDRPLKQEVGWFEYDLTSCRLDFVMDGGETRDSGMKLKPEIAKYMHNSHQIFLVEMDAETGQPVKGAYIPLVIHRA